MPSQAYDSLVDAVFYAGQRVRDTTQDLREAITAVYAGKDGKYYYADPVTGGTSHVHGKLRIPSDANLVSLVHNHPDMRGPHQMKDANLEKFSPDDIDMANALKVPSYIIYGPQTMRVYNPGSRTAANGEAWGYIPEVKVTAQKVSK